MSIAAAVQLLTTALVLLQLVSASPNIPQSMRDQAQAVAQQAIAEATRATTLAPQIPRSGQTSVQTPTTRAACPNLSRTLSHGMQGRDVTDLQKYLVTLGLLASDDANGYFGITTTRALGQFQCTNGIACIGDQGYGMVGERTRATISSLCTPTASGEATTIAPDNQPFFVEAPSYRIHPAKQDWLIISANDLSARTDLTGWKIRSAQTGKSFTIGSLAGKRVSIGSRDEALFIHTVGAPANSYIAEGEWHMYLGESDVAWGAERDTIQLIDPSGAVVDTYTYGTTISD